MKNINKDNLIDEGDYSPKKEVKTEVEHNISNLNDIELVDAEFNVENG